jgi:hypothetical protein
MFGDALVCKDAHVQPQMVDVRDKNLSILALPE